MRTILAYLLLTCLAAFASQLSAAPTQTATVIGMTIDSKEMNRRLIQLAESPDARFWRVDYDALSVPERIFLVVWELEGQVNNGGFHQYFWNSTGSLASHAPGALREIGALRTATIVENAIEAVGRDVQWHDDSARQGQLDAIEPERFERFDDAFYAYPDDLAALLYTYVSAHRAEMGVSSNF